MATLEAVKHKAGRLLGITRFGQALKADDDQLLSEAYTQVHTALKSEGIAVWASDGDVPDDCAPHVAALVAFNVADDKAVSAERYGRILTLRNVATPEIRRFTTPAHESLDEPTDY